MQEKPLRKFSLPKINVDCLNKIVFPNRIIFLNLIKRKPDERLMRESEIFRPNFLRGYPTSSLRSCCQSNMIESVMGNLHDKTEMLPINKPTKINPTYNKMKLTNRHPYKIPNSKKRSANASDFGWESDCDEESFEKGSKTEGLEARSFPSRLSIEKDTSPTWQAKDIYRLQSDAVNISTFNSDIENENDVRCDFLYRTLDNSLETEKNFVDEKSNSIKDKVIVQDVLCAYSNKNTIVQPVRCYKKKKNEIAQENPNLKTSKDKLMNSKKKRLTSSVSSKIAADSEEILNANFGRKSDEESVVITPKKTKDITKIKGWRRKQFLVEKPTTVEFYSYDKSSVKKKIPLVELDEEVEVMKVDQNPGNIENAFICDSLNEFLDKEVELRINYEIPHLYAEVGIKLTSEDLVSRPNLTEEDFKEVGSRYCVELPPVDNDLVILENESIFGKEKKCEEIESESKLRSFKLLKGEKVKRKGLGPSERLDLVQNKIRKGISILKTPQQRLLSQLAKVKEEKCMRKFKCNHVLRNTTSSSELSLASKLIGLVVYPDGLKPLHPVVRRHLYKLRSYRTKIDCNWANFAVSAVRETKSTEGHSRRKILPVHCAGKVISESLQQIVKSEVRDVVKFLVDSVCERQDGIGFNSIKNESAKSIKTNRDNYSSMPSKPKKCRVVLDKITLEKDFKVWCMEHECYNCFLCGLVDGGDARILNDFTLKKFKNQNASQADVSNEKKDGTDLSDNIRDLATDLCVVEIGEDDGDVNPILVREPSKEFLSLTNSTIQHLPTLFNERLTNLLAKKLKDVAFNDDILINIDRLKSLVPDGLEFIKLNFVKQSFLTGYINLWYLKPTSDIFRSRAFLTFSKVPPESNAINIDRNQVFSDALPKVITEIVSSDKVFANDEYAILHCNGKMWEIHGSLNIGINEGEAIAEESDLEVEQIVIPVPLKEMEEVRKAAMHILRVKATKWWVLDLSQKFSEVILNISTQCITVSKKHLLSVIKSKFLGFLVIKKRKGRLYGIYILENTFPFVLIGPYYTFEKCTVTLKLDSMTIPFAYKNIENLVKDCSLKFFINSVITALEANKNLVGLWLYDKKNLENACYLETLTTNVIGSFPKSDYSIETEHGYALNSLIYGSGLGSLDNATSKPISIDVPVYLYFDVFELGYVTGELQTDKSIVISHPLSPTVRIKSHQIGNLFIRLLKKRIRFIPNNFKVKWFVTKYQEDLRNRLPFNKLILGGAHILCQHGLLSMMKLSGSKIKDLGLKRRDVLNAMSESKIIHEVTALKNLNVLVNKDLTENLRMDQVLVMGANIIEELKSTDKKLTKIKRDAEETKLKLWQKYAALVNEQGGNVEDQIRYLLSAVRRKHKKREVNEEVREILRRYDFGKRFIEELKMEGVPDCNTQPIASSNSAIENEKAKYEEELKKFPNGCRKPGKRLRSKVEMNSSKVKFKTGEKALVKRLEGNLFKVCESLDKTGKSLDVPEYQQLIKKLNAISGQINAIKNIIKGGTKKPIKNTFKSKKKNLEDLQKFKKIKTKIKPEDKDRENKKPKEPKNVKFGFVKLDPAMFSGRCGNVKKYMTAALNRKENDISVVKIATNEKKDFSERKMLQDSGKQINGIELPSGSDKKFIIIKRGKNRVWSVKKLNALQAKNVFESESSTN